MKKVTLFIVISALVFISCGGASSPQLPAAPSPGAAPAGARPVQSEWEQLSAAARQEGNLLIVGTALGATKQATAQAFREKFGVSIEYVDGPGVEVANRVLTQKRAGLHLADVAHTGDATFFVEIKPHNITIPLEPFLFLPEVKDGSKWRGGQLPFIDQGRHAMAMVAMSIPPTVVNTDIVKGDEITKHTDLLNPRWKGKIVFGDPSIGGTGNNWFTHIVTQLHKNREDGLKFMREFAKQDLVMTRDMRQLLEWVARGKYPVGVGQSMFLMAEFKQAAAPIGYAAMGEPTFLSPGSGVVYVFDKPAHPNATKLYVNWLLSKEGAELWAPSSGYASLRLDVANSHMEPALVPPKDVTLKREEYIALQSEMRAVSREVFKDLFK